MDSELSELEWKELADRHRERVRHWTVPCRERRARGEKHPVHDFLFTYYSYPMGRLERWHPGWGSHCRCSNKEVFDLYFSSRDYRLNQGQVQLRVERLTKTLRRSLEWIAELLESTAARAGNFGCFGLHEWAMVYGGKEVRHGEVLNLRLPQAEVDEVVRSRTLCCTHFDAFRFFVPESRPMNHHQPCMDSRMTLEQPGCLHTNMDLYKWSYKAMPWVSSDLNWRCFELAMEGRELDMRASPYELRGFGYEPIAVETAHGRREYERRQRELSEKAVPLRRELSEAIRRVLALVD